MKKVIVGPNGNLKRWEIKLLVISATFKSSVFHTVQDEITNRPYKS